MCSMRYGIPNLPANTSGGELSRRLSLGHAPLEGAILPSPRAVQCTTCATTHGSLFLQQPGKIEMRRYTVKVSSGVLKATCFLLSFPCIF